MRFWFQKIKLVMKLSVVICIKNEVNRIEDCLETVLQNKTDEIIVVDGESTDGTLEILKKYPEIRLIVSSNSNLTKDRQMGLDAARNDHVAMIDADHRLKKDDLQCLLKDMQEFNFDIVQSGLVSYQNHGFWDSAEEQSWQLVQNIPGQRKMIGTAPAIYHKRVFNYEKFDDRITETIDDTDFSYRLSKHSEVRMGVGKTNIAQYHFSNFNTYFKKFLWYGKGDGEFCLKNPQRSIFMVFHLLIRYPFIYPLKAFYNKKFKASIFFMTQGFLRFFGLSRFLLKTLILRK